MNKKSSSNSKLKLWIIPSLVVASILVMWQFGFDLSSDLTNMNIVTIDQQNPKYEEIVGAIEKQNHVDRYETVETEVAKFSRLYVKNFENAGLEAYDLEISKSFVDFPFSTTDIIATVLFGLFVQGGVSYISFKSSMDPKRLFVFGFTNTFFIISWWIIIMGIVSLINFAGFGLSSFSLTGLVSIFYAGIIFMGWVLLSVLNKDEVQIQSLSEYLGNFLTNNRKQVFWQLLMLTIFVLPLIGLISFRFEVIMLLVSLWLLFALIMSVYSSHLSVEKWFFKKAKSSKK